MKPAKKSKLIIGIYYWLVVLSNSWTLKWIEGKRQKKKFSSYRAYPILYWNINYKIIIIDLKVKGRYIFFWKLICFKLQWRPLIFRIIQDFKKLIIQFATLYGRNRRGLIWMSKQCLCLKGLRLPNLFENCCLTVLHSGL